MAGRIGPLLGMLEDGRDSALLRFSLGNEYAAEDNLEAAVEHLRRCVQLDETYSAAWKLLGKCLVQLERPEAAAEAWTQGIEAAGRKGDRQAAKEMTVFLRRLRQPGTRERQAESRETD